MLILSKNITHIRLYKDLNVPNITAKTPADCRASHNQLTRDRKMSYLYWPRPHGALRPISQTVYELIILVKIIFAMIWWWWSNQVTILHMPRQLSCRGVCTIVTWSEDYFSHQSSMYCSKILIISLMNFSWNGCPVPGKKAKWPYLHGGWHLYGPFTNNFSLVIRFQ